MNTVKSESVALVGNVFDPISGPSEIWKFLSTQRMQLSDVKPLVPFALIYEVGSGMRDATGRDMSGFHYAHRSGTFQTAPYLRDRCSRNNFDDVSVDVIWNGHSNTRQLSLLGKGMVEELGDLGDYSRTQFLVSTSLIPVEQQKQDPTIMVDQDRTHTGWLKRLLNMS